MDSNKQTTPVEVPSPDLTTIGKGSEQYEGLVIVKTQTKEELMGGGKTNVPEVPY